MKQIVPAIRIFLSLTLITGIAYPLAVTALGKIFFASKAEGSLIERDGKVVGSLLIGQKFASDAYFWGRPSAVDYNPLPSGGSNLGPTSEALKKAVNDRAAKVREAHGLSRDAVVPQDLIFASASGLDPEISPRAAEFQIDRVLKARGQAEAKEKVAALIKAQTLGPDLGLLGEARVNVLRLNLAIDEMFGKPTIR